MVHMFPKKAQHPMGSGKIVSIVALCGICPNPHKSIELQFSKNYLTTKDPSLVRIQKIQKFRKIYSPDPEFRKFKTKFFLKYLVVNMCSQMDLL